MAFYLKILSNVICSCDTKLNFYQPLLQSSVSHDTSEIIIICWFIIIIINVGTVVLLNIFLEPVIFFFLNSLNKKLKEKHLFKYFHVY